MINLYYHGGSSNHGCEAIVRSTRKIIDEDLTLYTTNIAADKKYGLDAVVSLEEDLYCPPKPRSFRRLLSALHYKISHTDYLFTKYARSAFFSKVIPHDVYLSIGGDNYCYAGRDILGYYNRIIHEKGRKTILWGCSFEPGDLTDSIARDISRYDLIIARESISYDTLLKINPHTELIPDPAFLLDKVDLPLPAGFTQGNTVGINVSPLIMDCESSKGITVQNYHRLIRYIIETTDMQIVLIPHVVEPKNDDCVPLQKIYDAFSDTNRVVLLDDCNAMELKGYISRCRFFVGARTHATIAAYSTCVPTLVVGYSVKALGIARDIFGTEENYVLPVQSMRSENDLMNAFCWLMRRENDIRTHLNAFIPSYQDKVWKANNLVRNLSK